MIKPATGSFALLLHAHLPFVRHPEHENFLEEDWLFEALSESYLPLLRMMRRLVQDEVPFRLTMSLTPTLCAMLGDPLLQQRYLRHLERLIGLARQELEQQRPHPPVARLARFYLKLFEEASTFYEEQLGRDVLQAFRALQESGHLEIMASGATHAFLPLLKDLPAAQRAQIAIGCDAYRQTFGCAPRGFWLPECGFSDGLDILLQEQNIRWFMIDSHGLILSQPRPQRATYVPCFTPAGPAAFARDRASSHEVWSAECGYPGEVVYRDFYRDIGFERSAEELADFLFPTGLQKFSGLKYHRVTGHDGEKELYDPREARYAADAHAEDFWQKRAACFRELNACGAPVIVSPYDAELFGHWWFEGPRFLESFLRRACAATDDFRLVTPTEFLTAHPTQQVVRPNPSSWGEGGHSNVWLDEKNAWIYPLLHAATRRLLELVQRHRNTTAASTERALRQAARELLLAQASDWAFMLKTQSAPEYATQRTNDHLARLDRLSSQIEKGSIDADFLGECEARANLFPELNWRHFL